MALAEEGVRLTEQPSVSKSLKPYPSLTTAFTNTVNAHTPVVVASRLPQLWNWRTEISAITKC
jgi:hypothetical protein